MGMVTDLTDGEFNGLVAEHLEESGRPEVAKRSREMDSGMASMSCSDVARHEDLPLTEESIPKVAVLRDEWVTVHEQ